MADHTLRGLHGRHLEFSRHGGGVRYAGSKLQHIHPQKMLVVHARPETIAVSLGGWITGQVLECAKEPRMGVEPGR